MLNLSDLKPAVFMMDTVLRFLWNPDPYLQVTPKIAQHRVILSWCERHFGQNGPDAAELMEA